MAEHALQLRLAQEYRSACCQPELLEVALGKRVGESPAHVLAARRRRLDASPALDGLSSRAIYDFIEEQGTEQPMSPFVLTIVIAAMRPALAEPGEFERLTSILDYVETERQSAEHRVGAAAKDMLTETNYSIGILAADQPTRLAPFKVVALLTAEWDRAVGFSQSGDYLPSPIDDHPVLDTATTVPLHEAYWSEPPLSKAFAFPFAEALVRRQPARGGANARGDKRERQHECPRTCATAPLTDQRTHARPQVDHFQHRKERLEAGRQSLAIFATYIGVCHFGRGVDYVSVFRTLDACVRHAIAKARTQPPHTHARTAVHNPLRGCRRAHTPAATHARHKPTRARSARPQRGLKAVPHVPKQPGLQSVYAATHWLGQAVSVADTYPIELLYAQLRGRDRPEPAGGRLAEGEPLAELNEDDTIYDLKGMKLRRTSGGTDTEESEESPLEPLEIEAESVGGDIATGVTPVALTEAGHIASPVTDPGSPVEASTAAEAFDQPPATAARAETPAAEEATALTLVHTPPSWPAKQHARLDAIISKFRAADACHRRIDASKLPPHLAAAVTAFSALTARLEHLDARRRNEGMDARDAHGEVITLCLDAKVPELLTLVNEAKNHRADRPPSESSGASTSHSRSAPPPPPLRTRGTRRRSRAGRAEGAPQRVGRPPVDRWPARDAAAHFAFTARAVAAQQLETHRAAQLIIDFFRRAAARGPPAAQPAAASPAAAARVARLRGGGKGSEDPGRGRRTRLQEAATAARAEALLGEPADVENDTAVPGVDPPSDDSDDEDDLPGLRDAEGELVTDPPLTPAAEVAGALFGRPASTPAAGRHFAFPAATAAASTAAADGQKRTAAAAAPPLLAATAEGIKEGGAPAAGFLDDLPADAHLDLAAPAAKVLGALGGRALAATVIAINNELADLDADLYMHVQGRHVGGNLVSAELKALGAAVRAWEGRLNRSGLKIPPPSKAGPEGALANARTLRLLLQGPASTATPCCANPFGDARPGAPPTKTGPPLDLRALGLQAAAAQAPEAAETTYGGQLFWRGTAGGSNDQGSPIFGPQATPRCGACGSSQGLVTGDGASCLACDLSKFGVAERPEGTTGGVALPVAASSTAQMLPAQPLTGAQTIIYSTGHKSELASEGSFPGQALLQAAQVERQNGYYSQAMALDPQLLPESMAGADAVTPRIVWSTGILPHHQGETHLEPHALPRTPTAAHTALAATTTPLGLRRRSRPTARRLCDQGR